jgi:C-terminal processing protease CtpA/Prc
LLNQSYHSDSVTRNILDSLFEILNHNSNAYSGIILDLRNNYGGDLADLNFFLGRFINKPIKFGYTRYKSGPNRLDYTPWIPSTLSPQNPSTVFTHPIIALIDNYTVSLAEAVAMIVHTLPNGLVIGERTWGATGPLVSNEVYNDGQFSIPGFLKIYTSSAEFKYIDNKSYENRGFPPDIQVLTNQQSLKEKKDLQLERAILEVN